MFLSLERFSACLFPLLLCVMFPVLLSPLLFLPVSTRFMHVSPASFLAYCTYPQVLPHMLSYPYLFVAYFIFSCFLFIFLSLISHYSITTKLERALEKVAPLLREIFVDFAPFLSRTLLGSHGQELLIEGTGAVHGSFFSNWRLSVESPHSLSLTAMCVCEDDWEGMKVCVRDWE